MLKLLAAALAASLSFAAQAQLIKCVDEKGRTHYTDKPGACKGKQVDLQPRKAAPAKQAARKGMAKEEDEDARKKRVEKEKRDALAAKKAEEQLTPGQKCDALGLEFGRLAGRKPVVVKVENGMRYYMDEQEREKRRATLQAQMKKCK